MRIIYLIILFSIIVPKNINPYFSSDMRFDEKKAIIELVGYDRFLASWSVQNTNNSFSSLANVAAYESGFLTITDWVVITSLNASGNYSISASHGGWSTPTNYHSSGKKKTLDQDFQICIENTNANVTPVSSFDCNNGYSPVTTSTQNIIGGTNVNGGRADINAKILLDWLYDIPSKTSNDYSITITLTLQENLK